MPCRRINFRDGATAIVCGPKVQKLKTCAFCSNWAEFLCDYPVTKTKTCDLPMCKRHRKNIGPNLDYCHQHKGGAVQMALIKSAPQEQPK